MTNWTIGEYLKARKGKFEEIRGILYELFPEARLNKNFYGGTYPFDCGSYNKAGNTFRLIDKEGKDSRFYLSRTREGCSCGKINRTLEEVWTPINGEGTRIIWAFEDACGHGEERKVIETYRRYNKNFWELVPEAMDEWLKMQFGK